jgi:hypothetical protein
MYLLAGLFAHNCVRELQMRTETRSRGTTDNRAALWIFETAGHSAQNTITACRVPDTLDHYPK